MARTTTPPKMAGPHRTSVMHKAEPGLIPSTKPLWSMVAVVVDMARARPRAAVPTTMSTAFMSVLLVETKCFRQEHRTLQTRTISMQFLTRCQRRVAEACLGTSGLKEDWAKRATLKVLPAFWPSTTQTVEGASAG